MGAPTGDVQTFLADIDLNSFEREGYAAYVRPESTVVLMHIHVLSSSIPLIMQLIKNGFCASSIVIVPKVYSTIPTAEFRIADLGCKIIAHRDERFTPGQYDFFANKSLREGVNYARTICFKTNARRCILVDDGGILTDRWSAVRQNSDPFDAISVQQTTSGFYTNRQSAVLRINVASSAAKRFFESKIIVAGILRKLSSLRMLSKPRKLGIVGMGTLGTRVAQELFLKDHRIFTFDIKRTKELSRFTNLSSWQEVVDEADIILGCTGKNIMHFEVSDLAYLRQAKTFLSLSSRDVEFKSLLLANPYLSRDWPLSDLRVTLGGNTSHIVLNGGFPINFDRKLEWERSEDIYLTRGLVSIAILQALCIPCVHDSGKIVKLAIFQQKKLVSKWLKSKQQSSFHFDVENKQFEDHGWWARESHGDMYQPKPTNSKEAKPTRMQMG